MKSFARASSLLCALVLAFASAVCAIAAPGDRDYPIDYSHALPKLAGVRVPVLLPTVVRGSTSDPFTSYVFVAGVQRDQYSIDFWSGPECGGASVCRFAHMEAGRPGKLPLRGELLRLKTLGIEGYYMAGPCGFGCSDSTIAFDRDGWRYTLGFKGPNKPLLIYEAAALRLFHVPAGKLHPLSNLNRRQQRAAKYREMLETTH